MPSNPPVDFQALAQGAAGTTNRDYPYAIKATDLMRNFVFATLDVEDGLVEETTGAQGHRQRRLKIPSPIGAEDALQLVYDESTFSWKPITEIPEGDKTGQIIFWKGEQWTLSEAPEKSGQFLVWNEILKAYDVIVAPTADGQFLVWDKDAKVWKYIPTPTADGQFLVWDKDAKVWKYIPTPTADGQFLVWDQTAKVWKYIPTPSAHGQILNWDQTTKAWKHITAPTQQGQLLRWNDTSKNWVPLSGTTEGQLLQWDATNGWEAVGAGTVNTQILNWNNTSKNWEPFTAPPSTGTYVLGSKAGVMQWIETEACEE
jgi:hypothetical protein